MNIIDKMEGKSFLKFESRTNLRFLETLTWTFGILFLIMCFLSAFLNLSFETFFDKEAGYAFLICFLIYCSTLAITVDHGFERQKILLEIKEMLKERK